MAKAQSKGMKHRQASLSQASEASEIKNQQDWSPPGIIPSVDILAQSAAIALEAANASRMDPLVPSGSPFHL